MFIKTIVFAFACLIHATVMAVDEELTLPPKIVEDKAGITDEFQLNDNSRGNVSNEASPSLTQFYLHVWETHPSVQAAQAAVDAARSRMNAASQPLYNPELELDAERAETNSVAIGLSQTIDWADKRSIKSNIGNFELIVAESDFASVRQKIATRIGDALSKYYASEELYKLSNSRVGLLERFFNIAKNRYTAGDIGQIDLDLATLALSSAHLQVASTKVDLISSKQSLMEATGLIQEEWPALPNNLPNNDKHISDLNALLDKLPDLRARRAIVEASKKRINLAERFRQPDPTISFRGGREESDALVGLNLSIPLFVRNTFKAEVNIASNEAIQQEKLLQNAFFRARTRYLISYEGYRTMLSALEEWLSSGQTTLTDRVMLLQRLWEAGELNAPDYLIQVRESLDVEVAGIELRGKVWQSWFEWLDASGEIETWLGLTSS
jgi:outer membrane protein, heavy metal efflux system